MHDLPIIDVSGLLSPDLEVRMPVAAALGRACRDVGFFYVTNHGIAESVRAGAFAAARQFFDLPVERKAELAIERSPHNRGYAGFGTERLNEKAGIDHKEAFNIGLDLAADDAEVLDGRPFRGLNLWPDLEGWRDAVLAYYDACQRLQLQIHRGFALDLGLDEHFFDDKLDRPIATLRMLHYPAADRDAASAGPGAGEHTDYGNVTILATDGVAGLQVRRRDGVWLDAPHIEGAFVCNIGDCLMQWTNDIYLSTPHRVGRPLSERYSLAFFADANPDAIVEVLPACLAPGETARYAPITSADYLRKRLSATYVHLEAKPAA